MPEPRYPLTADLAGVLATAAQEQVQPPSCAHDRLDICGYDSGATMTQKDLSMRHILGVVTALAILAGGAGLSWLAWSLPTPRLLWAQSFSHPCCKWWARQQDAALRSADATQR